MNVVRKALKLASCSIASFLMLTAAGAANAAELIVNTTSVAHPGPSPITASLQLSSPAVSYPSVYVSPDYLVGTLDGKAVSLFAYCVDVLQYAGTGSYNVVPLLTHLGGDTSKYNLLAALIGAHGGPGSASADAATQAAVWEAIYDKAPYNVGSGNFSLSNVQNDPTLISDANAFLAEAGSNAGTTGSNLNLFVAENSEKQDMLFWSVSAVPEPSTWAMMLLGFGGIGFSMRRRRSSTALFQIA